MLCEILCDTIPSGSSGGSGDSEHSDIKKTVGHLFYSTKELKGLKFTLRFVR